MGKRSSRPSARAPDTAHGEWVTFPVLFTLVSGIVVFGVFHYSALLAVFSAIFAGFFGWLWWQRRTAAPARRGPRKAATRRRTTGKSRKR